MEKESREAEIERMAENLANKIIREGYGGINAQDEEGIRGIIKSMKIEEGECFFNIIRKDFKTISPNFPSLEFWTEYRSECQADEGLLKEVATKTVEVFKKRNTPTSEQLEREIKSLNRAFEEQRAYHFLNNFAKKLEGEYVQQFFGDYLSEKDKEEEKRNPFYSAYIRSFFSDLMDIISELLVQDNIKRITEEKKGGEEIYQLLNKSKEEGGGNLKEIYRKLRERGHSFHFIWQ